MTTESIQPNVLVARRPLDIVASVPYLLGYQPHDALVAVFFTSELRHAVTACVQLGPDSLTDSHPDTPAGQLLYAGVARVFHAAADRDACNVQLVLYSERPLAELESLLDWVRELASEVEMHELASGWVRGTQWFNAQAIDPLGESISSASAAAATWVLHGTNYLPDRESLRGLFAGEPTELSREVEQLRCGPNTNRWKKELEFYRTRRQVENELYDYLTAQTVSALKPLRFGRWLMALKDRRVREPLLARMVRYLRTVGRNENEARRAMDRVAFLVRNAPADLAPAVSSVAAAYAWLIGDGALAAVAAERGLAEDSDHILCSLVWQAVAAGMHPAEWSQMLTSLTLRQLRSAQPPSRDAHLGGRPGRSRNQTATMSQ